MARRSAGGWLVGRPAAWARRAFVADELRALSPGTLAAWRAFLYAQSALLATLDAELRAEAGLTLAELDALVQLGLARGRRLRMSELADRVLLSRSGVTRLVDRLVRDGWVTREPCAPDGRGAYAVLTAAGLERVRAAMPGHLAAVERHFGDPVGAADMGAVERGLARVSAEHGRPVPDGRASDAAIERLIRGSG